MTAPLSTPAPPARAGPASAGPWSSPLIGLGVSAISRHPRTRFLVRLGELAVGVGFVLATRSTGGSGHTLALVSTALSGLAWLGWILAGDHPRRVVAALVVLAVAGGACAATDPAGGLFVFVATAATAFSSALPTAVAVFAPAAGGFVAAELAAGTFPRHASSLVTVSLLGIVLGMARRHLLERARETAMLATAERRVALADREAQLTSERNRLGREIHDVLAHTLGAVSIQLTALDSRLDAGESHEELRTRVRDLHRLVGDGLQEARDAVRALRDDRLSLETQIKRLCAVHAARLDVHGRSYPLRADEALALYRVVQEALTNAAKHAPDAAIAIVLNYEQAAVNVTVHNERGSAAAGPLAGSGGGHGLHGMRARVELAGGRCSAGPDADGWRVTATLPRR